MSDRTATRRRAPRSTGQPDSPWAGLREKWRRLLASPQLDYKVILLVTGILVALGLVISLSSSMVTSSGGVFASFLRQAVNVAVGLVAMWGALRMRPATVQRWSPWLLFIGFALLLLVLVVGVGDDIGSRSWLSFGPVSFQPSEVAKLALAVWGSAAVSLHTRRNREFFRGLGAFLIITVLMLGLVFLQGDLGMMLSMSLVPLTLLIFSGVSGRVLTGTVGTLAVFGALAIAAMSYRSDRITTWLSAVGLNFDDDASQGAAYQARQGIYSLADGGILGTGFGQSRAKWDYLPEATNDFVFAIIGEETGLLGAGIVIVLFFLLGWFGIRTATRQTDPFLRLLAATLTIGVVGQAFYNMGYVVGLLPVTGVQLPLLSAGGTSAVITLGTLGLLANCARHEPETVSSMQHEGRPWIDRVLLLPEPGVRSAGSDHREQVRPRARQYGEPVTHRSAPRSGDLDRRNRGVPGERPEPRRRGGTAEYGESPDRRARRDTPRDLSREYPRDAPRAPRSSTRNNYRTDPRNEPRRRHRP